MKRYQCMAIGCPFETDSKGLCIFIYYINKQIYWKVEDVFDNFSINSQAGGWYLYGTICHKIDFVESFISLDFIFRDSGFFKSRDFNPEDWGFSLFSNYRMQNPRHLGFLVYCTFGISRKFLTPRFILWDGIFRQKDCSNSIFVSLTICWIRILTWPRFRMSEIFWNVSQSPNEKKKDIFWQNDQSYSSSFNLIFH